MSYRQIQKDTPYLALVYDSAVHMAVGEGKTFTVKEFAQATGLKLTHNLRRRLSNLVHEGRLDSFLAYDLQTGRIATFFTAPRGQQTLDGFDIPF